MNERMAKVTEEITRCHETAIREQWDRIEETLKTTQKKQKITLTLTTLFTDLGEDGVDVGIESSLKLPKRSGGHVTLALESGRLCVQAKLPLKDRTSATPSSADGAGKRKSRGKKSSRRKSSSRRAKGPSAKAVPPSTELAF